MFPHGDDDRIPTELWLTGHLHQLTISGKTYYIIHKGAYSTGTVMLKLCDMAGHCKLLQQQRDFDGHMGWMVLFNGEMVAEAEADAYICRTIDRDPDVWVVEIEDRDMQNPFDGKEF